LPDGPAKPVGPTIEDIKAKYARPPVAQHELGASAAPASRTLSSEARSGHSGAAP
jgi:hypothetical protein